MTTKQEDFVYNNFIKDQQNQNSNPCKSSYIMILWSSNRLERYMKKLAIKLTCVNLTKQKNIVKD